MWYARSENLTFEEAETRIEEIAKVMQSVIDSPSGPHMHLFQELARENVKMKGKTLIELRRLCGHHRIVPNSYKLGGVVKEGYSAQQISRVIEIWKGRYDGDVVALKVLRVPRDDPHIQRTKSVSTSRRSGGPPSLSRHLTHGAAFLQGSGVDEADQPRQHTPFLRNINDFL